LTGTKLGYKLVVTSALSQCQRADGSNVVACTSFKGTITEEPRETRQTASDPEPRGRGAFRNFFSRLVDTHLPSPYHSVTTAPHERSEGENQRQAKRGNPRLQSNGIWYGL
jgi:hypothetical protein